MTAITFILLVIFLTGLVFMFRLINNLYDKVETQEQLIKNTHCYIKDVYDKIDKVKVSIKNVASIVNTVYDNTVEISDINKVVNSTHDVIDALDKRVEQHWQEYQADFSLMKDMLNNCKYKKKTSNKQLGNAEKQSVSPKVDANFNYTKTDE